MYTEGLALVDKLSTELEYDNVNRYSCLQYNVFDSNMFDRFSEDLPFNRLA